jgi:uncharacterized protein (TIGR01777 family)
MNVTLTGATGLVGSHLVRALLGRGDTVTVLSRDADAARAALGVDAVAWDPGAGPAPAEALAGRDGVVHLAGAPVAQRWSARVKQAIRDSRVDGTRNLVAGLRAAEPRPAVLVSASGSGYYGPHGDEPIDESAPAGDDFLAEVCVAWEREAQGAGELGMRVVHVRTGVALAKGGGALKKMLPPFRAGIGGPVASGRQYMPWIHIDDLVGLYLAALDSGDWTGAFNGGAPEPATNREFSKALGRALHRPAVAPVPKLALRVLYGEMATVVVTGQRMVPKRALAHGYEFQHTDLDAALGGLLA